MIWTEERLEKLKEISRKAGEEIMNVYADPERFETMMKEDNSPLTLADQKSHNVIEEGLNNLDLDWIIVSEEGKEEIPFEKRQKEPYLWMVDPLDGTKEFVKRNGEFTVNIAAISNGESVFGMVYVPVTKELYWAAKGHGAWKEDKDGIREIKGSDFHVSDPKLRVVCSRSHMNEATQQFLTHLQSPELISKGSSLKLLAVAEGEAEIYPRLAPTMEWDTAAAHCIVEEAGGLVIRSDSKQPLRYNKSNLLNPHFIVFGDVKGLSGMRF